MVKLTSLAAVFATFIAVSAAPASVDYSKDPAVLAAVENSPKLKTLIAGEKQHQRRSAKVDPNDPAIQAAIKADPKLNAFLKEERLRQHRRELAARDYVFTYTYDSDTDGNRKYTYTDSTNSNNNYEYETTSNNIQQTTQETTDVVDTPADDVSDTSEEPTDDTLTTVTIRPLYGKDGPDPNDVNQGNFSDCWLAASMVSLAFVDRNWILPVLQAQSLDDGKVNVELWSDSGDNLIEEYAVAIDDVSYDDWADKDDSNSFWWPAAIEHAFLQYGENIGEPDILTRGGSPQTGLQKLTGEKTLSDDLTSYTIDEVFEWAQQSSVTPMILGTISVEGQDDEGELPSGLFTWHAYSVVGATVNGEGRKLISLRNPWGPTNWYDLERIWDELDSIDRMPVGATPPK